MCYVIITTLGVYIDMTVMNYLMKNLFGIFSCFFSVDVSLVLKVHITCMLTNKIDTPQ